MNIQFPEYLRGIEKVSVIKNPNERKIISAWDISKPEFVWRNTRWDAPSRLHTEPDIAEIKRSENGGSLLFRIEGQEG